MAIDLNSPYWKLQGLEITPPKKRQEWVQGADSDGSALLRDPLFENRTVTARLRVVQQPSMDGALAYIADLVAELEEAERNLDGVPLMWTPAGSVYTVTMYCLSGEIDGMPIVISGDDQGWFIRAPVVTVRFDCKPFLYKAPVTVGSTSSTNPALIYVISSVTGDVSAEARLVLTDLATQSRRWVEGGLQSRYYDAATNLWLDTTQLTITGFGGTSTTRTDSSSTNVFRGTLSTQPTAICGTGNKTHIGTYRVLGRCYIAPASGNAGDIHARFSYQDGSGVFRAGSYTSGPVANGWNRFDFGTITITQAQQGTQQWSGRVEAYSAALGDVLDVDALWLIPVDEGYFKVSQGYTYSPGIQVAHDEFTAITAGTVLNARTAPAGGTWATSGATTDFIAADAPAAQETETRSTALSEAGPRFAILGASTFTDTEAFVQFQEVTNTGSIASDKRAAVVVRWGSSTAYAFAELGLDVYNGGPGFRLGTVVAGTTTILKAAAVTTFGLATWYGIRAVAFASGRFIGSLLDANGNELLRLDVSATSLATGGALASGKPGFYDQSTGTVAAIRYYDNFYAATPSAEPIALYSGKAAEVRYDGYQRQDASSVWGPMAPRGKPLYLPPAGGPGRSTRVTVMSHRNDLSVAEWNPVTDNLQAQAIYTSRYLAVPR